MSELLQLLTLAKETDLSGRVNNLIAVVQSHDAEIAQLRNTVNQLVDGAKGDAIANVIFAWVGLAIFVVTLVLFGRYVTKLERRIKALEAPKT